MDNIPYLGTIGSDVSAYFRDSGTQWMFCLFEILYLLTLAVFYPSSSLVQKTGVQGCRLPAEIWLCAMVTLVGVTYYGDSEAKSTEALALLSAVSVGRTLGFFDALDNADGNRHFLHNTIYILIGFLVLAAFWQAGIDSKYRYHGQIRWSGPWGNPNSFGELMGTGMLISVGALVAKIIGRRGASLTGLNWFISGLLIISACVLGFGLLKSYCRGAWIGTLIGLCYMSWQCLRIPSIYYSGLFGKFRNRRLGLCSLVIVGVGVTLFLLQIQGTWAPIQRFMSTGSPNDFSLRNRVSAWIGAFQITADHPWFGVGWNQAGRFYLNYHLPAKLDEAAAIETNDYLMLSSMAGVGSVFCLIMYVFFSSLLIDAIPSDQKVLRDAPDFLKMSCRAGLIVLLVGFWFDGGLFKLPIVTTFWILLELGRRDTHEACDSQSQIADSKGEKQLVRQLS